MKPGTVLDLTLPAFFIGRRLLHAQRLATALAGDTASVALRARWEGLSGRILKAWHNPHIFFPQEPRAHQSAVVTDIIVPVATIPVELPQMVQRITLPLYEIFNFERLPSEFFQNVLKKMWKPKGKQ
jgi:hypothetical protein